MVVPLAVALVSGPAVAHSPDSRGHAVLFHAWGVEDFAAFQAVQFVFSLKFEKG
jgi:hypothetical protein